MIRRVMYGMFCMFVLVSVSQASTWYFNDNLEFGLNTTNSGTANFWFTRWGAPQIVPALTTTQSHSPAQSLLQDNTQTNNEFFASIPWHGSQTSYEAWIRVDNTEADNEEVAIWMDQNPHVYAGAVRVRRNSAGNFHYQASTEAGYNAWIDTGVPFLIGRWYHLGWEMDPNDSTFDLYISTGDFSSGPVASGSYASSVGAWIGAMYFSSWSSNPQYYIDDVKAYSGPILKTVADLYRLNVKDYGAKGDGVTDDTNSIQAAFDDAQNKYRSGSSSGGSYYSSRPEVVFPNGRYLISDSIYVSEGVISGEGEPVIIQTDNTKDIFTSGWAWRLVIRGLTFVDGNDHLDLANPNIDSGHIVIEKCRFYDANGVAVIFPFGTNSTLTEIRDCVFINCKQALVTYTDQTKLQDSWITSADSMEDGAVIVSHSRLHMENVLCVPRVNSNFDQRWIDQHYGFLSCHNVRFGGEGGGFTPVVTFAKFYASRASDGIGPKIFLDGCEIYSQGNPQRQCAVYCEEIPNGITIRNCAIGTGSGIMINPAINLNTYFLGTTPGLLGFTLENNFGEDVGVLDPLLENPIIQ